MAAAVAALPAILDEGDLHSAVPQAARALLLYSEPAGAACRYHAGSKRGSYFQQPSDESVKNIIPLTAEAACLRAQRKSS